MPVPELVALVTLKVPQDAPKQPAYNVPIKVPPTPASFCKGIPASKKSLVSVPPTGAPRKAPTLVPPLLETKPEE